VSVERNEGVVRRLFDEVWDAGRLDAIEELYAPDFIADHRPRTPLRRGHDGIKGRVRRARVAFPDGHEELEEMVAEGDKAVVRPTITGTQLGQWGPLPLTGKPVRFGEIVILRSVDGKVAEQRGMPDNLAALRQPGVMPTPPRRAVVATHLAYDPVSPEAPAALAPGIRRSPGRR